MQLRRGARAVRIGHRGAAALAPDNSLAAIEAAAAAGADVVELDVLRREDGELVAAHAPESAAGAPVLDAALARAAALGLAVQADVKTPGVEADHASALRRHGLLERSFASSSSRGVLRALAAVEPRLARSLSYPEDRRGLSERRLTQPLTAPSLAVLRLLLPLRLPRWLRSSGVEAVTLNAAVVSTAAIRVCHRRGVAVFAWTVNDRARATTLVESGIDGIITDDPRIVPPGIPEKQ
jgi:glycerophosphoryl diester phosphodiesterase